MSREEIIEKLNQIHGGDTEQLAFIFSEDQRILVTASAGCGKTKTMISKIAYELTTIHDMNFKKILALTFSVNAASKIKEDTRELLPEILEADDFDLNKKLEVANYHSFSTKLLFNHGYVIHDNLKNVEGFVIVPENSAIVRKYVIANDERTFTDFSEALRNANKEAVDSLVKNYIDILLNKLIPNNVITYNGLLILGNLLLDNPKIKSFYTKYHPIIIVDEFQDTNYLAYKIIKNLISDNNRVFLMGDDIQKIYGFLGAMPNLFTEVKTEYGMTPIEFKTNYRFRDNPQMLELDNYIREVFRQYDDMEDFQEAATINLGFYKKEIGEINKIHSGLVEKTSEGYTAAVLVNRKGSADDIIERLESEGISYFNGLFSDTDFPYQKFHHIALDKFIAASGSSRSVAQRVINQVIAEMEANQASIVCDRIIFNSLMRLLRALFDTVKASDLSREDKFTKIIYVLSNGSLKRLMNEIDEDIVVTTIHGSKGLEWDYIYIPQVIAGKFPIWFNGSLCKTCKEDKSGVQGKYHCEFTFPQYLKSKFEEQLSIFYVGITRARKDVFLFANIEPNQWGHSKQRSCLTALPNLAINKEF